MRGVTQYVKDTVERFSHRYPYPWPVAINVAGFSTDDVPASSSMGFKTRVRCLLDHRARNRSQPASPGSWARISAPKCLHGRGLQYVHRYRGVGGLCRRQVLDESATRNTPRRRTADTILKVLDNPETLMRTTPADAYPWTRTSSELFQGCVRHGAATRADPGRALRLGLSQVRPRLGLQALPCLRASGEILESEGGEDLSWFWRGWYLNNWEIHGGRG